MCKTPGKRHIPDMVKINIIVLGIVVWEEGLVAFKLSPVVSGVSNILDRIGLTLSDNKKYDVGLST